MEGKRTAAAHVHDTDAKRAKTDFPLDNRLQGDEYFNLSRLVKTPPYAAYFPKYYKKSGKRLLEALDIEMFNVAISNVAKDTFQVFVSPGERLALSAKG